MDPELLVTRYTTNIPDTLRHQQSIQRGLKKNTDATFMMLFAT